jgi:hypothetical protein
MRRLSAAYLTAAKSAGRYPDIRVVIEGAGTLTGSRHVISAQITRGSTSKTEYFEIGQAVSSNCTITIDRRTLRDDESDIIPERLIISGKQLQVYAVFNDPDGSEIGSALIGTYFITAYDNSDLRKGIISASDILIYTGIDFNPELMRLTKDYPVTLSDLLPEALRQAGLENVEIDLDVDPSVKSPPYKSQAPRAALMLGNPYTVREVLAKIAGMNLGSLFIDAAGQPKVYGYGDTNTTAITDDMIVAAQIGSETYQIDGVDIRDVGYRMEKSKENYKVLPYAPRFNDMDSISEASSWYVDVTLKANDIIDKPWTTGTVTIKGVGEIEPGDFVQAHGSTLLVTGIEYTFENACFNETLYSFAYTEEEYLMASQKSVEVKVTDYPEADTEIINDTTTGNDTTWSSDKIADEISSSISSLSVGVGRNVGQHNEIFNVNKGEPDSNTITPNNSVTYDYNTSRGKSNTLTNCQKTDVSGSENTVNGGNHVFGNGLRNTISNSQFSAFFGDENQMSGAIKSLIFGGNNIAAGVQKSLIGGGSNVVQGNVYSTIVVAEDINVISSGTIQGCIFTGSQWTFRGTAFCSILALHIEDEDGQTYIHSAMYSCMIGREHAVSYSYECFVGGEGALMPSGNDFRICIGNGNAGAPQNCFTVDGDGAVKASGGYAAMGADYAEMFEWADGNPGGEDRRGMLVALSGDKIIPAHGDDFIGIISANPSVIGNNPLYWHGKYKTDVFGNVIYDDNGDAVLSDDYDPKREYIPRSERPKWAAVGLTGRLVVVDDGSCVPGAFVSARQGRATKCYSRRGARVLRRIDETHVEVLLK